MTLIYFWLIVVINEAGLSLPSLTALEQLTLLCV